MKTGKHLPLLLSGVPFFAASAATVHNAETEKPNIVVILADDLGTNELGCYGGTNLQTPNIDSLAARGIRMTNNYASTAMSVPIRASLYTGLYPARHGSYQNHKASYGNLKSTPHYLANLGYRVGRTGKDHPSNQSTVYNFEKINGFTVSCTASKPTYATTNKITDFIQKDDDQPFCLFVCSIHPHAPWDAGDASKFNPNEITLPPNSVDNEQTRTEFCDYLAEIQVLDDEVGTVIEVLEKAGKLDNTMVIFLGEQGPKFPYGKWTCYRYGQHSAFIASYPKKIGKGITSDALVQYEDILPTMIEFAGGEPIADLDGKSCLPVLFGYKAEHRDWAYGIHNNIPEGTSYPIRSIQDKRYKLIVNLTPEVDYYERHTTVVNGKNLWSSWLETAKTDDFAKFLTERFIKRPALELYDLEADPWELTNIAEEVEHAGRIALMKAELERWMEQQGDRGAAMDIDNPDDPNLKTPIAISSFEDIDIYMRNDMNGNYYLENDIEIPNGTEWIPIGSASTSDGSPETFNGIFDGKGYSIKNIQISTKSNFKGFFARLKNAKVKNVDLVDVKIKGNNAVGGVSGAILGETNIEKVSVSGVIEGNTEVGGIAGRVATNSDNPGYNTIYDCFVDAEIKATSQSTDMANPSCSGGIVGLSRGGDNTYGKIDIRRVYFAGKIASTQKTNAAGNAAGILAFYDNHKYVKMSECLVLADEITAATPNYFFSRRGVRAGELELLEKLYVRDDITLSYLNPADPGYGASIPDGIIDTLPLNVFKTAQFYTQNLSWDFENTWCINEGEFPTLKRGRVDTSYEKENLLFKYRIVSNSSGITIYLSVESLIDIYDLSGKRIRTIKAVGREVHIPLPKGMYIVKLLENTNQYSDKAIVN